jgi:GNAT superfamily N-acetyltransferase
LIPSDISLRPITDADMLFLKTLYATTREAELERVNWTPEQKAAFIDHQFNAQHEHWQTNYTNTSWDVIERDGKPIGRLYVARWQEEIRIVDIALIPEARSGGLGEKLIRALFDEGDRSGRKVTVHVEIYNPAKRLYERMGFVLAQDLGVYHLLERLPQVLQ